MVRGALSDDHMIQFKVVTGTLNSQKYQDQILESGVSPFLDSLDGQNIVLRDGITRTHITRMIEEYINQQNIASLSRPNETYQIGVGQVQLMCLKPETSLIKAIVNFTRHYCRNGTGFQVMNACTQ